MRSEKKMKKSSLRRVVTRTILFSVGISFIFAILIENFFIIIPTMGQYKTEMIHEGDFMTTLMGRDYLLDCFEKTKDIYYNSPEELRADQYSDDYVQTVLPIVDQEYKDKRKLMSACREDTELQDIMYIFFDEEYERAVIVFDGNEKEKAFLPGQWISDKNGTMEDLATINKTIDSDWFLALSYGETGGHVGTNYDGIYDDNGQLVGYIVTNLYVDDLIIHLSFFLAIYITVVTVALIIVAILSVGRAQKRFIDPIVALTEKARQYNAPSGEENEEYKPVFESMPANSVYEIEELCKTMMNMEDDVLSSIKKIREATAAREKISTELELARDIQKGALPVDFASFAENENFEIYAKMDSALRVGGDFYDFFKIDDDHIGLVIADVSDKGIPAALFMMKSKSIIKSLSVPGRTPAEILERTNANLCMDNPSAMFTTAWLGIMNTRTGEVIAANAGHEYPAVTTDKGEFVLFEDNHGVVMGVLEDMKYEDYSFVIPPGGALFVYTDGVPEAQNEKEEQFGNLRMLDTLNENREKTPKEIIETMNRALEEYKGSAGQFDDITMLSIKRFLN